MQTCANCRLGTLVIIAASFFGADLRAVDVITNFAGTPSASGFSGDGGPASSAKLSSPIIITHDAAGNLFFSDIANQRVRRIDVNTQVITTVAGNGTSGFSGDNGPATSAQFAGPVGLAVDTTGNLYVCDQGNNSIRKVATNGTITTICGTGSAVSGSDGPAVSTSIATPGSMAYDTSGGIVFGELNGSRVRRVDLTTLQAVTFVGNGVSGFSGDNGPANMAQIGTMSGMTFDSAGNFYLIDAQNGRIRMRNTSGTITTIAGTGTAGFAGDGGPPLNAAFNFYTTGAPAGGIDVDSSGNIFVVDTYNQRIRKISSNVVSTICGTGTAGYNGAMIDATTAQLNGPQGIDVNSGKFLFCDTGNQVVRSIVFNASPVTISSVAITDPNNNAVSVIQTGATATFTATASNPGNQAMLFTWNFGDGGPGSMGNPVTHAYNAEGTFMVSVVASDGALSATQTVTLQTLAPNSGGQNMPNLSQGLPEIINPIDLLGISVANSNGGVIQLNIDTGQLRAGVSVSTEFDNIGGRGAIVPGFAPVVKSTTLGLLVATATATDAANNMKKGRKMLAIGGAEVGQPPAISAMPKSQSLSKLSLSGKFKFGTSTRAVTPFAKAAGSDSVTFAGIVELPAGLDLSGSQTVFVGVGNIIDQVVVNTKGKATLPSTASLVQKFQVKYPKLSKGATKTVAGQFATLSLTLNGSNFSTGGFDTEGVTGTLAPGESAKKPANRTIQVAFVVGGVPYQVRVPVQFKLGSNGSSGSIGGRSATGSL